MTKQRKTVYITHASAPHEDRLIIKLSSSEAAVQGSCKASEIFPTIKSLVAELFAEDWKVANQINRMDREEFASKYHLGFTPTVRPEFKDDFLVPRPLRILAELIDALQNKEDRQEGVAAVVEALAGEAKEDDNPISDVIEKMFDTRDFAWAVAAQGQCKASGKAWGAEYELRFTHAVGNWYVEGYVGTMKMRIFKTHSTIQIYLTTMDCNQFDMSRCDVNLSVHDKFGFRDWIKALAKRQAPKQEG
ncbi:hypothetical protein OBP_199 [Pseudomonas phage OBP]|uniref:hypothetical protein n=1 Tax=Pseudomonas phage OBP TaxID=1124849 RepID=UPI000240D5A7|nr:hypothetical protein OBP_199 [Pseudomonas phage OBP]AEV89636.1 hypothetical protein OBP_199 [Pseudomonas phage OBP]